MNARTPLYDVQKERGARFVPFAGWEMPVQFGGVIQEHMAVRERVGLFDVSHMGEFVVEGPGAFEGLQYAVTNGLNKLVPGRAKYTVMCTAEGGIVDDLIVYRESEQRFLLVVNAARIADDFAHLEGVLAPYECRLSDRSADYALMALQGPKAFEVLAQVSDLSMASAPPFSFVDGLVAGCAGVRVARTGYTGEEGVEIYCAPAQAEPIWCALEEAGRARELALCGLGARDTLRLEMKYPLYGNDIDLGTNPLEAGLGWVVKFKQGDFLGRDRLLQVKEKGPERKWVGFKMLGRGIPRPGYPLRVGEEEVGKVTSGTHSPCLREGIGVGYVPTAHAAPGTELEVMVRDKAVGAVVCETPFYQPRI